MLTGKLNAMLAAGIAVILAGLLAAGTTPAWGDAAGTAAPGRGDDHSLHAPPASAGVTPIAAQDAAGLERQWGIRIVGIRLSAAGYLLDFRYEVTDPEKAAPLLNRMNEPYLIDEATGGLFLVPHPPKVGGLRQNTRWPSAGRVYFILFANPGRFFDPGSSVTVVVGDFRVEGLTVEG